MSAKNTNQYRGWLAQTVRYEVKQQLYLFVVLFSGIVLYFLKGTALLIISQIYPVVVSSMVIGFVWRLVKRHNSALDQTMEQGIDVVTLNALERVGLFVQRNLILVVLSGYVAIAFSFAIAFHVTQSTSASNLAENFYFSVITLATVGYGDFTPTGWGRLLAVSEVLMGLAYQLLAFGSAVTFFGRFRH